MKSLYRTLLMMAAGIGMFASCSNDETVVQVPEEPGNTVHMIVTASRGGFDGPQSRTSVEEKEGSLLWKWTEGDKLLVTDAKGVKKGYLTLTKGENTSEATFEGELSGLSDGKHNLNYYYLGTKVDLTTISGDKYEHDFSNQSGKLESFPEYDIMSISKEVTVAEGQSMVSNLEFMRRVSYARFKLNPVDKWPIISVNLTGSELCNNVSLSLANDNSAAEPTAEYIKIEKEHEKEDGSLEKYDIKVANLNSDELYITYLPTGKEFDITFLATGKNTGDETETEFIGTCKIPNTIPQNVYLRKEINGDDETTTYGGIDVQFNWAWTVNWEDGYSDNPLIKTVKLPGKKSNDHENVKKAAQSYFPEEDPTREEYVFAGWTPSTKKQPSRTITYEATWKYKCVLHFLNLDDTEIHKEEKSFPESENPHIEYLKDYSVSSQEKPGKTQIGWSETKNSTTKQESVEFSLKRRDVYVYPVYKDNN